MVPLESIPGTPRSTGTTVLEPLLHIYLKCLLIKLLCSLTQRAMSAQHRGLVVPAIIIEYVI
jgi:hypothetical protein